MTDEAFHHKFGKIWADRTIPKLTEDEHNIVEDWAAHCFQTLLFNLGRPSEQRRSTRSSASTRERVIADIVESATERDPHASDMQGRDQHLPRADQDAAQRRHHHRRAPAASTPCTSTWTS